MEWVDEERAKIAQNFFFQAEDGIRDHCVTGVQTCALPICSSQMYPVQATTWTPDAFEASTIPGVLRPQDFGEIGRASCRERV